MLLARKPTSRLAAESTRAPAGGVNYHCIRADSNRKVAQQPRYEFLCFAALSTDRHVEIYEVGYRKIFNTLTYLKNSVIR